MTPTPPISKLRHFRQIFRNWRYVHQQETQIRLGPYLLAAPADHHLARTLQHEPYRNKNIRVIASLVSNKYPGCEFIDIGANIGDTAVEMCLDANSKLICVEPSPYYYGFLRRNIQQMPGEIITKDVLIGDGGQLKGMLHHWSGTAEFHEDKSLESANTTRLDELSKGLVKFIKLDVDGYDFCIIKTALNYLKATQCALLYECEIRSISDLSAADEVVRELNEIAGYNSFVVWDSSGLHLMSTQRPEQLVTLHRFLCKSRSNSRGISGCDILCLADCDKDIYDKVRLYYEEY